MTIVALEEATRALVGHFLSGTTVPGWTSLMVVLCLSNAALMTAVGILGEYVGKIYEEGKARPLYVVADAWNLPQRAIREETVSAQPGALIGRTSLPATDEPVWISSTESDALGRSTAKEVKTQR